MSRRASSTTGICELCGFQGSKASMTTHLNTCINEHNVGKRAAAHLFHIRAEGRDIPAYWLDVEVKSQSKLSDLDRFLREIWLECCGHLSMFTIDGIEYAVSPDKLDFPDTPPQRSMNARIGELLRPGMKFSYEYDYGSTTELQMKVIGSREGMTDRRRIRLLARNEPPSWPCTECKNLATHICTFCIYDGDCLYCDEHVEDHDCSDGWLPVVNSPRMGVCGYTGPLA